MRAILGKLRNDNLAALSAIVAWNVLTSAVPICVGLVAVSGLVLRGSPSLQNAVLIHLSRSLQGVMTTAELRNLVDATVRHTGILGLVGAAGVLWGGGRIGGAISTVFRTIFLVKPRSFLHEKLIDIGMIFVFIFLMLVIILATTAGAFIERLISHFPLSAETSFVVGTGISLLAGFMLFAVIYKVFPNMNRRLTTQEVWHGAATAAVLFEILSYIWPLYVHFAHFKKDGALLGSLVLLMAWVYFFALTLVLGAEVVAILTFGVTSTTTVPSRERYDSRLTQSSPFSEGLDVPERTG